MNFFLHKKVYFFILNFMIILLLILLVINLGNRGTVKLKFNQLPNFEEEEYMVKPTKNVLKENEG